MRPLDRRVLAHLRPARLALAAVVLGACAGGLLIVAQAFALAGALTAAVEGGDLRGPAAWVVGVFAARAVVAWVTDRAAADASFRVGTSLRGRLVAASLAVAGTGLPRHRTGELTLLLTRGVAAVEPYLTRYLPALVVAVVLPPATLLAMATQDVPAALVAALTLPLVPGFAVLVGMATRDRADQQWRLLSTLSGHFVDVVRGLPTLVAYDRATAQSGRIRAVTERYRVATVQTLKLAFASSAVLELVATLSVALVAVIVGLRLAAGGLELETALVVLLLAPEAYWPLRRVGAEFHAAAEGTATFEAADALLTEAAVAPRPAAAFTAAGTPGVTLRGVTVRYPGRTAPALDGVDVQLAPRGLTAVTGPSGCGKSTLLAVVLGRLAPARGEVRVEDPETWPEQVAWMPQRPWLMPATVRDNVRVGRQGADDADVWAALEQVRLAHHVATLPDGLDTVVAEDGATFSAGERARLALARVVVSDRPWVLLDEPTAHLDAETEAVVADTLLRLAAERAVVVVAHRPALAAMADHVVTLPAPPPPTPAPPSGPVAASADAPTPDTPPQPVAAPERAPTRRRTACATLLGALAGASGVALTATAGWLIVRASEHPPVLMLMVAIVAVRTFGIARPALRYAERLMGHDAVLHRLAAERAGVYDLLVPLVPGRLGPHRGDVLSSVVDDVDSLLDDQLRVRSPLWAAGIVTAGAVLFAAAVAPATAWPVGLAVAAGGVAAVAVPWLTARRADRDLVTARALLSDRVGTALDGSSDLVAWHAESAVAASVQVAGRALGRAVRRTATGSATGRAGAVLAAGAGVVGVLAAGDTAYGAGSLSGPMFALLALLPLALVDVLLPLADVGPLAVRTRAARARLDALRRTDPAVSDPADPRPAPAGWQVTVDGVAAGWGNHTVLSGVDLDLPPGGRVGVVGPSGSGKSTLVALLLRFLDPSRGRVSIGGEPLDTLALADVRRAVGLVDDDPHVFASTLRENLRLARPDATDQEILDALDRARLTDWVAGLPDGLDTFLGEGHAGVSGGERARIAVARAVLGARRVLVLDEPTAHLDTGTAQALADDLLADRDRSVVWVTHGRVGLERVDTVLRLGEPDAASVVGTDVGESPFDGAAVDR